MAAPSKAALGTTTTPQITIATVGVEGVIQNYAKQYGVSPRLATRIISCESKFKPNAVRLNRTKDGKVWSEDIGYWQINTFYWKEKFARMGLNISNPDDNLRAGFYILATEGSRAWNWSAYCWK